MNVGSDEQGGAFSRLMEGSEDESLQLFFVWDYNMRLTLCLEDEFYLLGLWIAKEGKRALAAKQAVDGVTTACGFLFFCQVLHCVCKITLFCRTMQLLNGNIELFFRFSSPVQGEVPCFPCFPLASAGGRLWPFYARNIYKRCNPRKHAIYAQKHIFLKKSA